MSDFLKLATEFLFVYLFQSFLFVFGIHLFSKRIIQWNLFFICAFTSLTATYVIRTLVTFGSHTLYSLIVLILLSIIVLKISVQAAVKSALLITIIMFVFEGINILLLMFLFGDRLDSIMNDSFHKAIAGIPPNVMLLIALLAVCYFRKRKLRQKGD